MAETKENLVKVVLLKEHTHKKVSHQKGAEINVRPRTVEWMKDNGVIK